MTASGGFWLEFIVRAFATGAVVVAVAWAAARLGPVLGGILVGLPIVLAPGFFFLLRAEEPQFVAVVAGGALYSLVATQVFLGAYIVASRGRHALVALLLAFAAWCVAALPLSALPHPPLAGAVLFAAATAAMWALGRRFLPPPQRPSSSTRWLALIARGVAAGILVGLVTVAARLIGPSLAGILLAYPVGFSVILLSLNLDHGPAIAAQTAHAGLIGVTSLAAFVLALALALPVMPPWVAFSLSLLASVLTTAVLGLAFRRRGRLR